MRATDAAGNLSGYSPIAGATTQSGPSGTVLSQASASLQPGQWLDITPSVGGGASIGALLGTDPGSHINEYSDKGTWNPLTREALYVGIAHQNGAEKFIKYSDANNAFSVISSTNHGNPQHSYQHNAMDVATGDLYLRNYNLKSVKRFRNGSWTNIPSIPSSSSQVAGALEAFPERNGILFVDGDWGVWWFNYSSNAWTHLAETRNDQTSLPKLITGSYHNVAVYNPVHKMILFGGGNGGVNSSALYKLDQNGAISTETTAPRSLAVNASVFTVDPASGDYLFFSNDATFWKYNPVTKVWTQMPSSQNPPFFTANSNGSGAATQGTVAYPIPTYGFVMFVT